MSNGSMNRVVQELRKAVFLQHTGDLTDSQLLERFIRHRDEAAFESLMRRHGPMVLAVCRRVLQNIHDAEDAFQACFLVLVRKAAAIAHHGAVASWLYRVAYRTALRAREAAARRRAKEGEMARRVVPADDPCSDLLPVLDQELDRVPDKYRVPIILCDLEGKTRKEAARQVGCPEGTLASRLARGRVLLARRLARHGLACSGGALALALSQEAAGAGVPGPLVVSTIKAAVGTAAGKAAVGVISTQVAALTEGVLKAMLIAKLKTIAALVLGVSLSVLLVGAAAYRVLAQDAPQDPKQASKLAGEEASETPKAKGQQLPAGPMPVQALAHINAKGQLVLKVAALTTQETVQVGADGWQRVTRHTVQTTATKQFNSREVAVSDTDGKTVDAKTLSRLLRKETRVLVSADGKKVDPLHLELIKEGTLVLVLPRKDRIPAPGNFRLWMPGGMNPAGRAMKEQPHGVPHPVGNANGFGPPQGGSPDRPVPKPNGFPEGPPRGLAP